MNEQNIDSVIEKLKALRMKTAAEHLARIIQRADTQNLSPLMIIEALVDIEEEMRQKNRILRRFKQSRLLEKPTIDQFDFHFHISRQKQKTKILNLMDMSFISPKKDVLFIGNTGVGKSFLAKVHRLCRHPARRQNPLHQRHGYDQSPHRGRCRSLSIQKTP